MPEEKKPAYLWDSKSKRIEKCWVDALTPPSSFRAVAERFEAQKAAEMALRAKRRKGIMD